MLDSAVDEQHRRGRFALGRLADRVALDEVLVTALSGRIGSIPVRATFVTGQSMRGATGLDDAATGALPRDTASRSPRGAVR
ncbi:hypothetical protein [Bounagaea algeriensis]